MKTFINWLAKEVYLCPALVALFEVLLGSAVCWLCLFGLVSVGRSFAFTHGLVVLGFVIVVFFLVTLAGLHFKLFDMGKKLIEQPEY